MRRRINELQMSWNTYVQPLAYGPNTEVHHTTTSSPFWSALSENHSKALVSKRQAL